ncbi:hypothetical protein TorRG33x02_349640 [Trema orientale]|uniref:Uncharacterized protein n=1 Tax=Trema orientale TaxID=63057 RepID=A0A2P5AI97_TREOI|nr:hypothetical protein TorRG33x02_349640 [Trema orientale]
MSSRTRYKESLKKMPNLRSRLASNNLAQQGRRYRRQIPAEKKLILSIPASKVRIQYLRNAIAIGNFDKLWWTRLRAKHIASEIMTTKSRNHLRSPNRVVGMIEFN